MKKTTLIIAVLCVIVAFGVYGFNYFKLQSQMNKVIEGDTRNSGIEIDAHYGYYIIPSHLVLNVKAVPSDKNLSDVFRVLLQFKDRVSVDRFSRIDLKRNDEYIQDLLNDQYEIQKQLQEVLQADPRNTEIEAFTYYNGLKNPAVLVYDLQEVSLNKSMADVLRVLLQFAEKAQSHKFESVELAFRGKAKFRMSGDYFQQLGQEYSWQNAVYTVRTLPENLKNLDGTAAYPEWTGGLIGVVGKQMEDVNDFHRRWWLEEMIKK